ncbi:hypothetical protein BB559_006447 [Furculomyces boomerangus]|uniref:Uncharacterized protein n=2 Tax=Furculomyces boomerangus TaxID=61424 RepID=A0A2T9Y2Y0_9FUNG|nr:hypothetical protein BB559_006447 [Furculomyces boomerangus]
MEKYSKWRDFGTGIQPFLQIVPPNKNKSGLEYALLGLKSIIFGPTLLLARLVILTGIAILCGVTTNLASILIPLKTVRNGYQSFMRKMWSRIILFTIGFYKIDERLVSLKQSSSTRNKKSSKEVSPKSGDIIISNHSSYIDLLFFIARFDPVFVKIDNATLYMTPYKGFEAVFKSVRPPSALLNASEARSLSSITTEARINNLGPVVAFPENTTSNGLALLKMLPIFGNSENLDEKSNLFVYSLRYPFKYFSPTYSIGNAYSHFAHLCSQIYNKLAVVRVSTEECPKLNDENVQTNMQGETEDTGKEQENGSVNVDKKLGSILVSISRLRQTKLSALDKLDFLKYYNERLEKYKSVK